MRSTITARLNPDYLLSPNGNFAYMNAVLRVGNPLELYTGTGMVAWNGDIVIPMLIDMRLRCQDGERFPRRTSERDRVTWGAVWMALTPAEMISQRSGIARAEGKTVIGGLGLGWFLRKVCAKTDVDEVIVVEKNQELLDWYGVEMGAAHPKVSEVICDDVYNQIGRHGQCQYLLDIWPTFAHAGEDTRLQAAKKELGDCLWAWGLD